jgi:hypothetical protein
VVDWYYRQVSNTVRGGYLRFIKQYVENIPIPKTNKAQQDRLEQFVDVLQFLHDPQYGSRGSATNPTMASYIEQWLNGLVYELYFEGELHANNVRIFDETNSLLKASGPEPIETPARFTYWKEVFDTAYDETHKLREALFNLKSVPVVWQIEEIGKPLQSMAAQPAAEYDTEE